MKRWMPYVDGMAEEPEGPYVLYVDCEAAAQAAEAAECHEEQTHTELGAILGTDTSLLNAAHRLEDRCVSAEAEAARLRNALGLCRRVLLNRHGLPYLDKPTCPTCVALRAADAALAPQERGGEEPNG